MGARFDKIELLTNSRFGHVAFVSIPPFNAFPDVLIWGERYFVQHPSFDPEKPRYVEGFTYYVVPTAAIVGTRPKTEDE